MMDGSKKVVIIGAGLVGSLLSIYLARRGYKVSIYERRGDMRKEAVEAGRSINLALSDRGLLALEEVGISKDVLSIAIPMHGRQIHMVDRTENYQPYGKQGQFINSVSRRELNCKLMDLAESVGVPIIFNHRCEHIDWNSRECHFVSSGNEGSEKLGFDVCFGSDGAYSASRMAHMLQHNKFEYHQYYIDCGYKELAIPARVDGGFQLEKNRLHIWPRKEYMLIALPNLDGTFTGTLFFPFDGELSFAKLTTPEAISEFFKSTFPDVVELIPDLVHQFQNHPTSSLVTVKCYPWIRGGNFSLIGDAAHAIVPFFGQGMNAGFEDCRILNKLIGDYDGDWEKTLAAFQELRKPDADAIADLAVTNFTEMRERTADPTFLLQKKIEAMLHEHHPDQWIPAYSQVTFSPQIRYSEALKKSKAQEALMQEIMARPDIQEVWNTPELEEDILSRLKGLSK